MTVKLIEKCDCKIIENTENLVYYTKTLYKYLK